MRDFSNWIPEDKREDFKTMFKMSFEDYLYHNKKIADKVDNLTPYDRKEEYIYNVFNRCTKSFFLKNYFWMFNQVLRQKKNNLHNVEYIKNLNERFKKYNIIQDHEEDSKMLNFYQPNHIMLDISMGIITINENGSDFMYHINFHNNGTYIYDFTHIIILNDDVMLDILKNHHNNHDVNYKKFTELLMLEYRDKIDERMEERKNKI